MLFLNNTNEHKELPRTWRSTSNGFKKDREEELQGYLHTHHKTEGQLKEGLENVLMSGSAQISKKHMEAIKDFYGEKPFVIIDLRKEPHGFIDGAPVSWREWSAEQKGFLTLLTTREHVEQYERMWLEEMKKQPEVTVRLDLQKGMKNESPSFSTLKVQNVQNEQELAKELNIPYQHFPVTDHQRPSDKEVDNFVTFTRNLPKGTGLHFHCKGGQGRTTTFMSMYDMMLNIDKVDCRDIVHRQRFLGGQNITEEKVYALSSFPGPEASESEVFRHVCAMERIEFLKEFSQYAKENQKTGFAQSWSEWKAKQVQQEQGNTAADKTWVERTAKGTIEKDIQAGLPQL